MTCNISFAATYSYYSADTVEIQGMWRRDHSEAYYSCENETDLINVATAVKVFLLSVSGWFMGQTCSSASGQIETVFVSA